MTDFILCTEMKSSINSRAGDMNDNKYVHYKIMGLKVCLKIIADSKNAGKKLSFMFLENNKMPIEHKS